MFETLSPDVQRTYRCFLKKFLNLYVDGNSLEEMVDKYFGVKRNWMEDLDHFFATIMDRSPGFRVQAYTVLKTTFLYQNIDLPERFWKILRKRLGPRTQLVEDYIPSIGDLRKIVLNAPPLLKTIVLVLVSTGARVGEILKINLKDLDLEHKKIILLPEYTKNRRKRTLFLTEEAANTLKIWLKMRERYLEKKSNKKFCKKYGAIDGGRVFPVHYNVVMYSWNRLLKKLGYKARRHEFTLHNIRKWFRTRLGPHIPIDIVEALMGHEGYLTKSYRKYSDMELEKYFREKCEPLLTIFEDLEEKIRLEKKLEEKDAEMREILEKYESENLHLKIELNELRIKLMEMENKISRLQQYTALPLFKKLLEKIMVEQQL